MNMIYLFSDKLEQEERSAGLWRQVHCWRGVHHAEHLPVPERGLHLSGQQWGWLPSGTTHQSHCPL